MRTWDENSFSRSHQKMNSRKSLCNFIILIIIYDVVLNIYTLFNSQSGQSNISLLNPKENPQGI